MRTPKPSRPTRFVLVAVCLAISTAACGGSRSEAGDDGADSAPPLGFAGSEITDLSAALLPDEILGLDVQVEEVSDRLELVTDTYVEALTLFSMRRDDLLMATLQVSRLGGPARPDDPDFRRGIVNQIGAAVPREVRLGEQAVWLSTGTNQRMQTWFKGDHFFVLTIRGDYERPRTLLRALLEVEP